MDLSKYTLEECLDFIEKEGYTIRKIHTLYYIFVMLWIQN